MKRLEEILVIQSESLKQWRMFAYLIRSITKMDGVSFFVQDGNIYITKGKAKSYPCVVAHMDTVHRIGANLTLLKIGDNYTGFNTVTMTQTGIGGDDKVGIFIALECLVKFDNIKIAFFRDEEIGCQGSYEANMNFFKNCGFVLQCDRRGNEDFITNASGVELSSKDFRKRISGIVKGHGYKYGYGMMTDVMALKEEGLKVSCANISCGYYNPHCDNEYVNKSDVANCMAMVFEIIELIGNERFNHNYHKPSFRSYGNYGSPAKLTGALGKEGWMDDLDWPPKKYDSPTTQKFPVKKWNEMKLCDGCQQSVLSVKFVTDYNAYLCDDCQKYFK